MENLTLGIEIEYRDLNRKKVDKYIEEKHPTWTSKIEDAISKGAPNPFIGGEIVSPILKNTPSSWQELADICNFLIVNHASPLNTGAHIHIGANILENNSSYLLRFIKLWCSYEHVIYRFSYGEYIYARDTLFDYSPPVGKELKYLMQVLNLKDTDSFDYLLTVLNLGKKRGLNLSNINQDEKKNTIEFRCPNGSFNKAVWYNNFLLFTRMLEYAKSNDYDEDLINQKLFEEHDPTQNNIDLENATELANLIYKNEKEKLLFLKQYLKGYEETKEYKLARI